MFIRYDSGSFFTMASLGLLMVSAILGQDNTTSINTTLPNSPLIYANDEVRVQCNDGLFEDQPPTEFGLIFPGNSQNYRCVKSFDGFAQSQPEASLIEPVRPANDSDCRELVERNSFEFVFKPREAELTYQCLMYDGTTIRRSRNEALPATILELPTDTQLVTDGDNYYEGSTVTATCTVTGGDPTTTTYQYSFGGQIFDSPGLGSWMFEANRTMTGNITCISTEHLQYRDRSQPGLVASKTINIYWLPTDTQLVTDGENYYEGWDVTATCNVTGGAPETTTYHYSFAGQTFNSTGAWTFSANRTMTGNITCISTEHLLYGDRSQPGLVGSKTINIDWLPTDTQLVTDGDNYYEGWNVTATCNVTGGFPETTTYQYSFGGQTFNSPGLSSWTFEANRTMTGDITCTSTEHLLYTDRSQPELVASKTINIYYIDLKTEGVVQRVKNPNYNDSLDCRGFLDTNLPTTNLAYSWTGDGIADGTVTNEAVLRLPESEANGTIQYTCDITGPKFRNTDPDQKRQVVVNVMWSLDAPPPFTTLPPLPINATLSPGAIGGISAGAVVVCLIVIGSLLYCYITHRLCFKRPVKSGAEKTRGNLVEGVEETPLDSSSKTNQTENRRYPSNNGPNADLYTEVVKEKPAQPAQAKPEPLNYADLDHSGTPRTVASVQPRVRPSQNDSVTYTQVVLQKAPEGSTPAQSVEIEMVENDLYSSVEKPAPIKP